MVNYHLFSSVKQKHTYELNHFLFRIQYLKHWSLFWVKLMASLLRMYVFSFFHYPHDLFINTWLQFRRHCVSEGSTSAGVEDSSLLCSVYVCGSCMTYVRVFTCSPCARQASSSIPKTCRWAISVWLYAHMGPTAVMLRSYPSVTIWDKLKCLSGLHRQWYCFCYIHLW